MTKEEKREKRIKIQLQKYKNKLQIVDEWAEIRKEKYSKKIEELNSKLAP